MHESTRTKPFFAFVGRDGLFLATSLIVAESWLGASDFRCLPCRFLYNRAFNVDKTPACN